MQLESALKSRNLAGAPGEWRGGDDFSSPYHSLETVAQPFGQSLGSHSILEK